jgi:hypothetical protein
MPGVFHVALDLFQTANGWDYLGIVIFYPEVIEEQSIAISQFVLECLKYVPHIQIYTSANHPTSFGTQHTGVALAKTLHVVLSKFGIQDWVCV